MSHAATNWAIKQRGLKPAAKVVLWHLCDRHNPDYGCFVSQERLAEDCEMSRSSLNDQLALLEDMRLLRRVQRRDPRTKRQVPTRYHFAFEPDFEDRQRSGNTGDDPCPDFGHGAVSEKAAEPCPKKRESRVRNPDTNPVREPVSEPLRENAQARGQAHGPPMVPRPLRLRPPPPEDDETFDALATLWPMKDKLAEARAVWAEMEPEDRTAADAYAPTFLAGLKGKRSFVEQLASYLRGGAWRVAGRQAAVAPILLKPHSRAFWATAYLRLGRGENIGFMLAEARRGHDWQTRPAEAPTDEQIADLVPVEVGSEPFKAWEAWFGARRVSAHLIRPDQAKVIWCPSEWPPGFGVDTKAERVGA